MVMEERELLVSWSLGALLVQAPGEGVLKKNQKEGRLGTIALGATSRGVLPLLAVRQ